jgi:hypothetical protein
MHDGPGDTSKYIEVHLESLREAARVLSGVGTRVGEDLTAVRQQAVAAFAAIPPSDMQNAYGYCWGRWSKVLQDASDALAKAGKDTDNAADTYHAGDTPGN